MINIRTDATIGMVKRKMRERLAALVPYLQRAISIGRLFDQSRAAAEGLTGALDHVEAAVFLIGADGAISFANAPARQMLGDATQVCARDNALHAIAADTDQILHDTFRSAATGDASFGVRGVAVPLANSPQESLFAMCCH